MRFLLIVSMLLVLSVNCWSATEPNFPAVEVLAINAQAANAIGNLSVALQHVRATRLGAACRYVGRVEINEADLKVAAAKVNTLLTGVILSGDQPPLWLTELEKIAESVSLLEAATLAVSASCDSSTLPDVNQLVSIESKTQQFVASLAPFNERAINELIP